MNKYKKLFLAFLATIILCLLFVFIIERFKDGGHGEQQVNYSQIYEYIIRDTVLSAKFYQSKILLSLKDGNKFISNIPNDKSLLSFLLTKKIQIFLDDSSVLCRGGLTLLDNSVQTIFSALLKILSQFILFMGLRHIFSKGSVAEEKENDKNIPLLKFSDLSGMKKEKQEIQEIATFLQNPHLYDRLGCKLPKGAILYGPPGNGKTMLAKALAGEVNAEFFYASAAQFIEMYVGVGASRVRLLFDKAKEAIKKTIKVPDAKGNLIEVKQKAIIFIDEIDSLGFRGKNSSNGESDQTINQLLTLMDGFDTEQGIFVFFATNILESVDPALIRSGRVDRSIEIGNPDVEEREELFKFTCANIPNDGSLDFKSLAQVTSENSRADIVTITNEAKFFAARQNKNVISMQNFNDSLDKLFFGFQKKQKHQDDVRNTAYHESGHAFVYHYFREFLPPMWKMTILPFSKSLGFVAWGSDERVRMHKQFYEIRMMISLAGRVCEEIFFGLDNTSVGCSSDLENVRNVADIYVNYGLDEEKGAVIFNPHWTHIAEKEKELHFVRVKTLIKKFYDKTFQLINENKEKIIKLSEVLLKKETLDAKQIHDILMGIEMLPIPYKSRPSIICEI